MATKKTLSNPPYGNCLACDKAGNSLFRCDLRKMHWYLSRGLARRIQEDPPIIELLFAPKGVGHDGDDFFLQARENKCVVCGITEDLTRHHILPHSYRRWFPRELDPYGTYDVMLLCVEHHEAYERHSEEFRQKLAKEYGAPVAGRWKETGTRALGGAAKALLSYRGQMPKGRIKELEAIVRTYTGNVPLSRSVLKRIAIQSKGPSKTHSQIVVSRLHGYVQLGKFVIRWRKHFMKTMRPQHLPDAWEVGRIFTPQ